MGDYEGPQEPVTGPGGWGPSWVYSPGRGGPERTEMEGPLTYGVPLAPVLSVRVQGSMKTSHSHRSHAATERPVGPEHFSKQKTTTQQGWSK